MDAMERPRRGGTDPSKSKHGAGLKPCSPAPRETEESETQERIDRARWEGEGGRPTEPSDGSLREHPPGAAVAKRGLRGDGRLAVKRRLKNRDHELSQSL